MGVYAAFLTVACAALCVLVLRLSAVNSELREQAGRAVTRAAADFLPAGAPFPGLKFIAVRNSAGPAGPLDSAAADPLAFTDGRAGSVIVFVSKSCPHCEHDLPYFQSLAGGLAGRGIVCIAIEVDALSGEAIHHAGTAELPVAAVERPEATWLRKIPMVPGVAVVGPDGVVRLSAFGTLDDAGRAGLEAAANSLTK